MAKIVIIGTGVAGLGAALGREEVVELLDAARPG